TTSTPPSPTSAPSPSSNARGSLSGARGSLPRGRGSLSGSRGSLSGGRGSLSGGRGSLPVGHERPLVVHESPSPCVAAPQRRTPCVPLATLGLPPHQHEPVAPDAPGQALHDDRVGRTVVLVGEQREDRRAVPPSSRRADL